MLARPPAAASVAAAAPVPGPHIAPEWNATSMPAEMAMSRSYTSERAFLEDAKAMALTGWRMVNVRFGPRRRRLLDRLRFSRAQTRSAVARYLRP